MITYGSALSKLLRMRFTAGSLLHNAEYYLDADIAMICLFFECLILKVWN